MKQNVVVLNNIQNFEIYIAELQKFAKFYFRFGEDRKLSFALPHKNKEMNHQFPYRLVYSLELFFQKYNKKI